jgi:hypothetical protein
MSTALESTTKPEWARDLPDTTDEGEPIVYGPKPMAPRVEKVEPKGAAVLRITFETGEARLLDCHPLLDKGVFRALADPLEFRRVHVINDGGGIEWESGADLSRDTLYHSGTPV